MRRFAAFSLSLLAGLVAFGEVEAEAADFRVAVGIAAANPGQRIELPVTLKAAAGIANVTVAFAYDPQVMVFEGAEPGALAAETGGTFNDDFFVSSDPESGEIAVSAFAIGDTTGEVEGELAKLGFTIRPGTKRQYSEIAVTDVKLGEATGVKDVTVGKTIATTGGMVQIAEATIDPKTGQITVEGGETSEIKEVELDANGKWVEKSGSTTTGDPATDLAGERKLVFYRAKAKVMVGGEPVEMVSDAVVGALKVESGVKQTPVAVPWTKIGGGDLALDEVIVTSELTEGDRVHVYEPKSGTYRTWRLSGGVWREANTLAKGLFATAPKASAVTIPRGGTLWVERENTAKPIILTGKYEADNGGATAVGAGWNLIGNPKPEPLDFTGVAPKSANDTIIVTTGGAPKIYTHDGNGWGYAATKEVKLGSMTMKLPYRKTGDNQVPLGQGFWYVSEGAGEVRLNGGNGND